MLVLGKQWPPPSEQILCSQGPQSHSKPTKANNNHREQQENKYGTLLKKNLPGPKYLASFLFPFSAEDTDRNTAGYCSYPLGQKRKGRCMLV